MLLPVTEGDVGMGGRWEGGMGGALRWVVFAIGGGVENEVVRKEGVGVCGVKGDSDIVKDKRSEGRSEGGREGSGQVRVVGSLSSSSSAAAGGT